MCQVVDRVWSAIITYFCINVQFHYDILHIATVHAQGL